MKAATKRPTKLPAHIQHLHGTHYLVKFDSLQLADVADNDDGELGFINPRHAVFNYQGVLNSAQGFDRPEMDELHAAICAEGLQNPFICRWLSDGTVQIVDGERRQRTLSKAIVQGDVVYNEETEKMEPAAQVYAEVHCKVHVMDDEKANGYAFSMNDRAMTIGDGAAAAWVKYLRDKGLDDTKILHLTKKKAGWLKDTDALATLEPEFWEMLCKGKMDRTAGLKLLKIEGTELREKAWAAGFITAGVRHEKKIAGAEEEFQTAQGKEEMIAANVPLVKHTSGAGSAEAVAAEEKVVHAEAATHAKEQAIATLQEQGPTIEGKDIQNTASNKPKPLTVAKIQNVWEPRCHEIIKDTPADVDAADARLVTRLCMGIRAGYEDIEDLLRLHKDAKDAHWLIK